jgi:oligopeptide transport system substrate-binding protein
MKKLTRFSGYSLVFLSLIILLSACFKQRTPTEMGRLRISFNSFPGTADPRKSGDFISSTLICMVFDGLSRCLPDGSVELAIAERMEISSDQKTYTFYLRDALWTDGTPVTAYDFERSWKQILKPGYPSVCPYLFYSIKNAENARNGKADASQIGIHALNERTLQVILERPTPYFLSLTAFPSFLPNPPNGDVQFDSFSGSQSFICNGPFVISSIKPNAEIVLKKNDKYWNHSRVKLGEIQISIVSDETTAWKLFEHGELDWIGGAVSPIPADSMNWIAKNYNVQFSPMAATTFCTFQTQHPYLRNINLRRAFSLAINRTEIIEQITQMGELPATRCIPPSLMGFRNKTLYQPFDPELARLHMEKALHELGISRKDLNGLILSFRSTQINRQISQAIQRQWKKILDVDVGLNQCEANILRDRLQRHDYDMALHFWVAQYSDPINILERFQDLDNPKNIPGWYSSSYNNCVQAAIHNMDPLDRLDLIETAEQILINEMPLAPIYHWTNPSLCQPWVKNLRSTPNGGVLFEGCWISHD